MSDTPAEPPALVITTEPTTGVRFFRFRRGNEGVLMLESQVCALVWQAEDARQFVPGPIK